MQLAGRMKTTSFEFTLIVQIAADPFQTGVLLRSAMHGVGREGRQTYCDVFRAARAGYHRDAKEFAQLIHRSLFYFAK